jgi:hypothetical protein
MSNTFSRQIIQDGCRNGQVKIDGLLDSTDAVLVPAFALSDFLTNDQNLLLCGFCFNSVDYSIPVNMIVSLYWEATIPQSIAQLTGSDLHKFAGGLLPDRTRAGYTGNILLSTKGFDISKAQGFTLTLEFIKLYTRGSVISADP